MAKYINPYTAEVANFSPEQRAEYEQSRMNYLGVKAVSETAKEEGKKEGYIEIAKRMKKEGFDIQVIKSLTNLLDEDLEQL